MPAICDGGSDSYRIRRTQYVNRYSMKLFACPDRWNLSKTYNSLSETYYSYDAHGRVTFTVQTSTSLNGAPGTNPSFKTVDYKFTNLSGRLNEVVYQKGKQDEFHHYYTYDADGRLVNAKVSRIDQSSTLLQLASYNYYLHGPLKNTTLGDNIQDIDYVYNINGMLKAINNPIPGTGGSLYPNDETAASGVLKDVFAEVLNYYHGDYNRLTVGLDVNAKATPQSSTAAFNATTDLYSGNISSVVTKTAFDQANYLPPATPPPNLMIQSYKYDVLQRLNNVFTETGDAATFVGWNATAATGDPNGTQLSYDAINDKLMQ